MSRVKNPEGKAQGVKVRKVPQRLSAKQFEDLVQPVNPERVVTALIQNGGSPGEYH